MNVKPLFNNNESPDLKSYMSKLGVDLDTYKDPNFVEPYSLYDNINNGVKLLEDAIECCKINLKYKIVIVCDSDCDGYCSATMAVQFLLSEGLAHNNIKVLFHTKKQHGLSNDILAQDILTDKEQLQYVTLIWLPDAGTNDVDQCDYFNMAHGIPILITDHHEQSVLNQCATIINNQTSPKVTNKDLCGTGVTHKLISAYCTVHSNDFYLNCIDLVALATISDVMDMRSLENRTIVKWGIEHINNNFLRGLCGILIDTEINPTTLAWKVVPKINAVCRSDNQKLKKRMFFAFVTGKDYSQLKGLFNETKMKSVVGDMIRMHEKQRANANELYEQAIKDGYKGDKVKVFSTADTPYTGLVAMKLSSHYNCPCMVVHDSGSNFMGSLRSPCDMRTKLKQSGLMKVCEGHEASCGVGWNKRNTNKLLDYCNDLDLTPNPKDVIISTDNIFIGDTVFRIAKEGKEYWGTGIPDPKIHISNILINGQDIKELGRNKTTIKFLYGDIEFLSFFMSKDKKAQLNVGKDIDMTLEIIGTPSINEFRGRETKQVIIDEWEIVL